MGIGQANSVEGRYPELVFHSATVELGVETMIDFSNIPGGVQLLLLVFDRVSLSGTDQILVRMGTPAAGIVAVGYASTSARLPNAAAIAHANSTTSWIINTTLAADIINGHLWMTRRGTSNIWNCSHTIGYTDVMLVGGGRILDPGDRLDRIRLLPSGANNFDNGIVALYYL